MMTWTENAPAPNIPATSNGHLRSPTSDDGFSNNVKSDRFGVICILAHEDWVQWK